MKIRFFLLSVLLTCIITLTSCASKEKPPRERDETFIADINSFEIGQVYLYAAFGVNKPKIQDYSLYFVPRTNHIYFTGKIGVDNVMADFSYTERKKLLEAKEKYISDYENKTLPKDKPNKKNAYSKGNTTVSWGTIGIGHTADTTYMTNVQYILEGKPYFRIHFDQAREAEENGVASPSFAIYISPSQWETIVELCNQDSLVAKVDEILTEANAF